jgi:glycosyltransferase involved in cell wall biosynthesis
MVLEVFEKVYDHPLIDEILIVDDASNEEKYTELLLILSKFQQGKIEWKIRVHKNKENLGMLRNKREAISKAKNEWVILFDSDNELYLEYLEAIAINFNFSKSQLGKNFILHPSLAEPEHDYSRWNGMIIDSSNAKDFLHKAEFRCLLNNCNYVVNRDEYLRVYKYDESIKESDTIYFNTLWLEAGNAFYVVPGMRYHHRKHSGSGWLNGCHKYNMKKANELQEKIRLLK